MRSVSLILGVIVVVAGVCVVGLVTSDGASRAEEPRAMRVAVVNLQKVFEDSKIYRESLRRFQSVVDADFKESQQDIENRLKEVGERIREKEAELASEDSLRSLYQDERLLKEKKEVVDKARRAYEAELQVKFSAEVLATTLLFVEDVAKAQGYDLVLKNFDIEATAKGGTLGGSLESAQIFQQLLSQASLLYVNRTVVHDITDVVKSQMMDATLDGELKKRVYSKLGRQ